MFNRTSITLNIKMIESEYLIFLIPNHYYSEIISKLIESNSIYKKKVDDLSELVKQTLQKHKKPKTVMTHRDVG
jgi:hypothetical protein